MSGARRETTRGIVDAILSDDLAEVVTSPDTFRPTPEELTEYFTSACLNNRLQIAQYLLDKGARINYLTGFAACYRGKSIEIFGVLVKNGWDINSPVGSLAPGLRDGLCILQNHVCP